MERYFLKELGIEYVVKQSTRAKRVSIAVHHTHEVVVTKPRRISLSSIHDIVRQNIGVIEKMRAKIATSDKISLGASREDYLKNKKLAEDLLAPRVKALAHLMDIKYEKLTVRYQVSRWGSCSSTGTISLNYKLIKLPIHLQDYVIIHELAHRKEMNHSSRFWKLVEQFDPQYKQNRKELQRYF
ncbi:MAG TPA: M48 family metallopeptidase [Candidatus Paceibacterota bacterium]